MKNEWIDKLAQAGMERNDALDCFLGLKVLWHASGRDAGNLVPPYDKTVRNVIKRAKSKRRAYGCVA